MAVDRDEVLWRTDLGQLCDQVLGPRRGRGISGTWPCPAPGHGHQTGKSPPVGIFRTHHGEQRWRCHSCGAGGTAIDLVMQSQGIGFSQALEQLGRQVGAPDSYWIRPDLRTAGSRQPDPPKVGASAAVERYVATCAAWLWSPAGRVQREWLRGRGLDGEVLKANRIGADPGPRRMPRAAGLPRRGMAVVLPVLDQARMAVYCQARYLGQRARRFDNPTAALAGSSPRFAEMHNVGPVRRTDAVVVCEGVFDALSATQAGLRAVAVLGAATPDETLASQLATRFPADHLVVAFDGDDAGRAGGRRLAGLLEGAGAKGRAALLDVPSDLNDWLVASGSAFPTELGAAVDRVADLSARSLRAPGADLARQPAPISRPPLSARPLGRALDISW